MNCKLCGLVTAHPIPAESPRYCHACYYSCLGLEDINADLLADLTAIGVRAEFCHTGGGCMVLEIPLCERRSRLAWVGWHDRPEAEDGDWLIGPNPPKVGTWFSAGVYPCDADGYPETDSGTFVGPVQAKAGDSFARIIRALATEAQTITLEL